MRGPSTWLVFICSALVSTGGMLGCTNVPIDSHAEELSRPGPWTVPESTRRVANAQRVTYTGAGPWIGTAGCGGGLRAGAGDLRHYLLREFPQISGIGGYSCRPNTAAPSQTSVHGTGRALDIHIPLHGGAADNDAGDVIANWLIEHTEEIGIQYVIWDRWQWNSSLASGSKERRYTGPNPHIDHLHVELTEAAASRLTAWFTGPMAPPTIRRPVPATCDSGTPYHPRFCDDDGHWGEVSINYIYDHGFTRGCGTTHGKPMFCPDRQATRGEVLTIFGRASGMPTGGHPDAFDDDDGHYSEPFANAAASLGITDGCGARRFCPSSIAPRSHMAAFLTRIYALPPATRDHFDDDDGDSFEDAHNRLAEAGITSGCGTRRFCGDEPGTRAMLATFTHRVHARGFVPVWVRDEPSPTCVDHEPAPATPEEPAEEPPATPEEPAAEPEPPAEPTEEPRMDEPEEEARASSTSDGGLAWDFGEPHHDHDHHDHDHHERLTPGPLEGGCSLVPSRPSEHSLLGLLLVGFALTRRRSRQSKAPRAEP